MMKQYEQFLQKFPDVHYLEIKQTHTFKQCPKEGHKFLGLMTFAYLHSGGTKPTLNFNYCDLVEGEE